MISANNLKNGTIFLMDESPFQVLEVKHLHMGRGGSSIQTKIKNLANGKVVSRTIHPSETFEEAEIEKREAVFVFEHRGQFTFHDPKNPKERFIIDANIIGDKAKFLKADMPVTQNIFNEKIIGVSLPIKADYKVTESPPNIKGSTASGSGKTVTLENGLEVFAPMFINEGDIVRVNTETGEYVERIEKR